MNVFRKLLLPLAICLLAQSELRAQAYVGGSQTNGSESNNIITAVPFLLIVPDARTGGMGNAGVATAGDANASSVNPAKLPFLDASYGISVSYSPWLKNIVPNVSISYLSGYYKLDERNVIGASLRYFSLGEVQLTDINQQPLGVSNPNELAADLTFSRRFGSDFALGGSVRFVSSNLTSGLSSASSPARAGRGVGVDVAGLYKSPATLFGKNAILAAGFNMSNVGTKISYSNAGARFFMPSNLKIGGAATVMVDDYNEFTLALDLNKLLVPTQPVYDSNGQIVRGQDPDRSVPSALFGSFSDAPGGFSEELKEVGISTGVEYWYNQQFALRLGYNYENEDKGNSKYVTLGAGVRYSKFNFDFSYIAADLDRTPLANTLRFSVIFNYATSR